MLVFDPRTLVILEVNQAACGFYGWTSAELLSMRVDELTESSRERIEGLMARILVRKTLVTTSRHKMADGTMRYVEGYMGLLRINGEEVVYAVVLDIGEKIQAQRERDSLMRRLNHYMAESPTITYSLRLRGNETESLWVSENIQRLLGYSPEEALAPSWWFDNIYPQDRLRALGSFAKLSETGRYSHEYRFRRKDRSVVWIRDELSLAMGEDGESEIIGTLTDISERKAAEAEYLLKSTALEATANSVLITDSEGIILWVNVAFERLTGFSKEEALGKNPGDLLRSGKNDAALYRDLWKTIRGGGSWQGTLINRRKRGDLYTEEMTITPVPDENGRLMYFIAVQRDITKQEEYRSKLELLVREKEILLGELHHRIKNNMQLMISMVQLSLEKCGILGPEKTGKDLSRRFMSMALVHDLFYHSEDYSAIDFGTYLRSLGDQLISSGSFPPGTAVTVDAGDDSVTLDLEQAVSAGMAAAELISNALEYAYPVGTNRGPIEVTLRRRNDRVRIEVRDYGVGLPEGFSVAGADSLGMLLITSLAEQLKGEFTIASKAGTRAVLEFPIRNREKEV